MAAASNLAETSPIAHPDRFYIGGAWIERPSDSCIEVIALATEEPFVSARAIFGPWARSSPSEPRT